MSYPNVDPRDLFGQDLIKVFGPKVMRRHVSTLSYKEKEDIIKKLPLLVDTDDLGPRPSIFQVVNKILTILQQSGTMMGIDLDWCDDLRKGQLVRHDSAYVDISVCYKNNDVQRGIWLQHLVRDILFSFNPTNVLSGLARKLKDGTINLNNGQHRTVACVIVGVRQIPIEYIASDLLSVDVDEYATDNLNTLASSEYDNFRIRVWRNKIRKSEGRTDLDDEDVRMEDLWDIHASKQSRFVEKGTANPRPLECTGVGNMRKYFKQYGRDLYIRALDINCTVWNKAAISTANCWGLMEFLETQRDQKGLHEEMFDFNVQQAIQRRYSNPGRSGMHHDFKNIINKHSVASELKIPEEKIIAAGIYKICKVTYPTVDFAPILFNARNVADEFMTNYRIMPPAANSNVGVYSTQTAGET